MHAICAGYDLYLYVNSANGPFGHLLRIFGKRTVLNTDGLEWLRPQLQGLPARYYRWASVQAGRSFQVLVSDSQEMADVYRGEFGSETEVISYGAQLLEEKRERDLAAWGWRSTATISSSDA